MLLEYEILRIVFTSLIILESITGVDILPFGRIRYPGTISWLWGRITGGTLHCQQFFKNFRKLIKIQKSSSKSLIQNVAFG